MPDVQITVAIPTFRRARLLEQAVASVAKQKTDYQYEMLVLDNACDVDTRRKIEEFAGRGTVPCRYIPVAERGLHNCRNLAASAAYGQVIVYIDDDVVAPSGWLNRLSEPILAADDVAGVAGKVCPSWEAPPPSWIDVIDRSYFSLLDLGDMRFSMRWPTTPYGCNMAFRRDLVLSLGGFGPDGMPGKYIEWFRGDGETGFAKRIYDAGHTIVYVPDAWLYHRIPKARWTVGSLRKRAAKSAVSSFYSEMRSQDYSRWALIGKSITSLKRAAMCYLRKLSVRRNFKEWIQQDLRATVFVVTGLYQLRLVMDERLRKWVRQRDYLNIDYLGSRGSHS